MCELFHTSMSPASPGLFSGQRLAPLNRTRLHHAQAPAALDHTPALPQGDGGAGPTFTGGAVGGERNLVILDAGDVLDDAFPVSSPRIDAEGEMRSRLHRHRSFPLPQSSSASRLTTRPR